LESELKKLTDYLLFVYKEKGIIPVVNYQEAKSSPGKGFFCSAGRDRISVSPGGDVHGCFLFHDYLKGKEESEDYRNYSFGNLDHFINNFDSVYPTIIDNYKTLRQSSFFTDEQFCFLCEDVKECLVCPVNAAYSTSFTGKLPPWICSLNRIRNRERKKFREAVMNLHL
jgi:MoaA/NifB/PqqE/SkfB family radical SAM enzyme